MNISVVGKVSVGKSSFINTFHYLINDIFGMAEWTPVTSISIKRETFQPINLIFGFKQDPYVFEQEIEKNAYLYVNKPEKITYIDRHVNPANDKIKKIVDFPGFDDLYYHDGKSNCIAEILENMSDITIFVTDAARAFVDQSECDMFDLILKKSEELNRKGHKNEVIILVNKFDHIDQEDLNEIFNGLPKTVKKFKWCSYAILKNNIMKDNNYAKLATAPCDIDKFMDYIFADKKSDICILDFIPVNIIIKMGQFNKIHCLRLIYKYLEEANLEMELDKLSKTDIAAVAKILLLPAGDKKTMISGILNRNNVGDTFTDIFYNIPAIESKAIKEKLGITIGFYEYYKFFGLSAIEHWTVPYLQVLAKSMKIKTSSKKKSDLIHAIINIAKPN